MKTKLVAIIVGAAVVVGGGYFVYTKFTLQNVSGTAGNSTAQTGNVNSNANTNTSGTSSSGTFASLIARGENLMCTFEYNDGANITAGTVYMADKAKHIRGDFDIKKSPAGPMKITLVRTDGYNHIWGSAFPQGFKTKVTAEEENRLFSAQNGGVSENTVFNCSAWTVDASKFTLPSGTTFIDASVQMR